MGLLWYLARYRARPPYQAAQNDQFAIQFFAFSIDSTCFLQLLETLTRTSGLCCGNAQCVAVIVTSLPIAV